MNSSSLRQPAIRIGWLRVVLFCVFYFILNILASALSIALVKKLKGDRTESIDNLLSGEFLWVNILIIFIISFGAVYIFRKFIDRKTVSSLGFETEGFSPDGATGLLLSLVILGLGSLILHFSGHLFWTDIVFNGRELFIALGMMVLVAFYEEVVFRGYILNNLMESSNKWVALLVSAGLFTLFHWENPGATILPLLNIFLAGVLLGINYVYTKNLWYAILFHFGWNFFEGPVMGFKVSGLGIATLLQTELKGDIMLTGGDFGFEGSIIDAGLTVVAIILLYWVYEKKYRTVAA